MKNPYEKLLLDLIREMRSAQLEGNRDRMDILQELAEKCSRRFNIWAMTNEISEKITERMRGNK